ncbi:MAG: DUF1080 domain-containing protein, partial [Planctomycetaceae bacterium]|nr:DUF1080 domain-containing protein [Planctomycetaceae bacterium]
PVVPELPSFSQIARRKRVNFKDHQYVYVEGNWTIDEARRVCAQLGGQLAQIESAEESQFLLSVLQDHVDTCWIDAGYNPALEKWTWSDGNPVPESRFLRSLASTEQEQQSGFNKTTQNWSGLNPSKRAGILCEWNSTIVKGLTYDPVAAAQDWTVLLGPSVNQMEMDPKGCQRNPGSQGYRITWAGGYKDLQTKGKYRDFDMECEFRFPEGPGNSGVRIRKRLEIELERGMFGAVWDETLRKHVDWGSIGTPPWIVRPSGWNKLRVRAEGSEVIVWINDVLINKYQQPKTDIEAAPIQFLSCTDHKTPIDFRNIKLQSSTENAPAPPEPDPLPKEDDEEGNGLIAEFFDDDQLKHLVAKKLDPNIDCQWSKPHPKVPVDHFSVRWTGYIKAPVAGAYRFTLLGDDGFRLWIDDALLINNWKVGFNHSSATVTLTGKPQKIRVEYFDFDKDHWISFWWQPIGFKIPSIVPNEVLFPNLKSAESKKNRNQLPDHGLMADYLSLDLKRNYGRTIQFRTESMWGHWSPIPKGPADGIAHYAGYLVVPKTGRYKLTAWADDQMRVYIDGKPVLEADIRQERGHSQSFVELTENTAHAIGIKFLDRVDWGAWWLRWTPPGTEEPVQIPLESLYPNKQSLPKKVKFPPR